MNLDNWQEKERLWWAKLEQCQSCGEFWATYASYLEDVGSISKHRRLLLKWAREVGNKSEVPDLSKMGIQILSI